MVWCYKQNKFPNFGEEVRRPYEVAAPCFDCRKFIKGCKGKKAKKGVKWHCDKVDWYNTVKAR